MRRRTVLRTLAAATVGSGVADAAAAQVGGDGNRTLTFDGVYGSTATALEGPFPQTADPTLNTAVGVTTDEEGNVWVADTGNDRLLVLDADLERVLGEITAAGTQAGPLDLPLRVAHDPVRRVVYVTDLGNSRVLGLGYDYDDETPQVRQTSVFAPSDTGAGEFTPNDVAAYDYDDEGLRLFVTDEFYHESATDLNSRVVVFNPGGQVVDTFQTVSGETETPLYWPQGVDVDSAGRLYVANTGYGLLERSGGFPALTANVVRCDRTGDAVPFEATGSATLEGFGTPRDVTAVAHEGTAYLLVADAGNGTLSAYGQDGSQVAVVPPADADNREFRKFVTPGGVTPVDGGGLRVALAEATANTVTTYDLDLSTGTALPAASVGGSRDGPDQFGAANGVAPTDLDGGTDLFVAADGSNRRGQVAEADDTDTEPTALGRNLFPGNVATYRTGPGEGYLFAADLGTVYRDLPGLGQVKVYRATVDGEDVDLTAVTSFGAWGFGPAELRSPQGMTVEGNENGTATVTVADSLNARVSVWTFDPATEEATSERTLGSFGVGPGQLWYPADVARVEGTLVVADDFNNRLQAYQDGEWTVVGGPGYDDTGDGFLLPTSVASADGHLLVADLVNRAVKAFALTTDDGVGVEQVAAYSDFGGGVDDGEFWVPYSVEGVGGTNVVVSDRSLNVVHRFDFS